jgi:hypothetical protein
MDNTQHQIELEVGAALECAEAATWTTNELVGRTLETAVTGKEAATTLHHAYSAQVHIVRVLDWTKERTHPQKHSLSETAPSKLGDCLSWMRRAQGHAENSADAFRHRRTPAAMLRRLQNGRKDGRKITWRPKAALKNPWRE